MLISAIFALLVANLDPAPVPSATPTATTSSPTPDIAALTTRFTAFFTDVLAGKAPTQGLTDKMQTALTPAVLSQLQQIYGTLGTFQKLSFKFQDSMQGFQRYHYTAVFQKGSPGVMFVVDSSDKIAGFFNEP
jgi:hypothetical protein